MASGAEGAFHHADVSSITHGLVGATLRTSDGVRVEAVHEPHMPYPAHKDSVAEAAIVVAHGLTGSVGPRRGPRHGRSGGVPGS
ncbi:hypothetical protein [Streptomyces sp. NPDC006368]|uniref:hypothetical protein n=1 Tax=Streptomyces sp. NPDC006368 TaxID=3156760 RepID=UPI0033AD469C